MTTPAENITKEGIEVKPGQVWKDLDKRQAGRQCKVTSVSFGKAKMESFAGSKSTVSVRRMHNHSTGWELVSE
ncbi:hypothetical protein ACV344_31015 [Pseudomonas aeruginosa]|uniref:hypothetical protein n=1 Tax=Pseudomonas aeruginosa TaxID=287 RepID=UPI000E69A254|nr:hypothetical protein [Pseudomonas aeruginosa]MBA5106250.1 hypothetical protein [Pseudomonas aeruginosa]MBD1300276.1 hypothetical protein [Pseudomonas aeruginosa]MBD1340743.1 hypothetical protein [Pseudomonas aeruginosa]MBH3593017.1 hypothetical protein [Pseudomonas aeruginosa]MCO2528947.1 hypothetical protein [Pseudomonas aeruginosa]